MMRRVLLFILPAAVILWILLPACVTETGANVQKKEAEATKRLGISMISQGDFKGGLKELERAVKLDPDDPETHYYLGSAYRDTGDTGVLDKAEYHLKRALELRPDYPEAQNSLGTVYLLMRRPDDAIKQFEAVANNLTYRYPFYAYNNLGTAYHQKMDYAQAVRYYQKAVELFDRYSAAYDNMGLSYEDLNRPDKAIEAYLKAVEYAPDEPLYHLHLGAVYLKVGRKDQAVEALHRVIETDKSGRYKKEARALIERARRNQ